MQSKVKEFVETIHAGYDELAEGQSRKYSYSASILKQWGTDEFMSDMMFPVEDFIERCVAEAEMNNYDSYFSVNSFYGQRKESKVRHLNCFVIDYDFYNDSKYAGFTAEEMLEVIRPTLKLKPTFAVDSGRGLYLVFCFKHSSKFQLARYKAIWKGMIDTQKRYGADPKVRLSTQVIRIPGTLNSKSGSRVEIIEHNQTDYCLDDFNCYLKWTETEVKAFKNRLSVKSRKDSARGLSTRINTEEIKKTYMNRVFDDIRKLIEMRNERNIREGYREYVLYLIQYFVSYYGGTKEAALEKALEFNSLFLEPMSVKEVQNQCNPAWIGKSIHSVKTIIEKLDISYEEQSQLTTLIDGVVRNERYNRKRMRKRLHKLLNRTEKQMQLMNRRGRVYRLFRQGKRKSEIAKELKISIQQVRNDLKYLDSDGRGENPKAVYFYRLEEYIADTLPLIHLDEFKRSLSVKTFNGLIELIRGYEVALE